MQAKTKRDLGCALLACALVLGAGCGGSGGGARVAGAAARAFGPAGGILRGPAGTSLEGLEIEVPKGALARFVTLKLQGVPAPAVAGAAAAGAAFRLDASPDPGRLAAPLQLRVPVRAPRFRADDDLLVLRGETVRDLAGGPPATVYAPLARTAPLDRRRGLSFAASRRFGLFVPVLAAAPRRRADAAALVTAGLRAFQELTPSSLARAARSFAEARLADPFDQAARFLAALTRIARLLEDRSDDSPALDSVGEVLARVGVPLPPGSLLAALAAGRFPGRLAPPAAAPDLARILEFLRKRVVPELAECDRLLASVGDDFVLPVSLQGRLARFGPRREFDDGEVGALRAALRLFAALFEWAAAYDFRAPPADLARLGRALTPEEFLRAHPSFGTRAGTGSPRAAALFAEGLARLIDTARAIAAETDDQRDDVLTLRPDFPRARLFAWLDLLERARLALQDSGTFPLRVAGRSLPLRVRPSVVFDPARFVPRALAPPLRAWLPVAAGSFDPTFGGLFPGLARDEAIRLFGPATEAQLVSAEITLDGKTGDWPAAAALLQPDDARGDARGLTRLPAVDGTGLYAARALRRVFFRLDLADGPPAVRARYAAFYSIRGRDLGRSSGRRGSFEVRADLSASPPKAQLLVPGHPPVPCALALGSAGLEIAVPLIALRELVGMDRSPRARLLSFEIRVLDRDSGERGGDDSRPALLSF